MLYPHMWNALPHLWHALLGQLTQEDIGGNNRNNVQAVLDTVNKLEYPDLVLQTIRHLQLKTCYNPSQSRVTWIIIDANIRTSMHSGMMQIQNVEHKASKPPPSGQEDEMEKWLQLLES